MLCQEFYKNGNPCRNRMLPGYSVCGIHGGFSIKSAIRKGNFTEFLYLVDRDTVNIVRAQDFIDACEYRRLDMIKYLIEKDRVHPVILQQMTLKYYSDPEITACFPVVCDLCDAINNLTVKSEPCSICQSEEDIDVLVLPCCKNVMCSACIKSWNSEKKSCAFCRATIF